MEPNAFPQLQLWCPRPFGTYSQNKPCAGPGAAKKPFSPSCRHTENTPPPPSTGTGAAAPPAPPAPASEEGRVLLDTWYVIKPGNTKEKVAFFVAHQCGAGARASTMKVKGNWGSDSSKAKRRRRCHDPAKAKPSAVGADEEPLPGEAAELVSVAEMVALVEQRRRPRQGQDHVRPVPVDQPVPGRAAHQRGAAIGRRRA